MKNVSKTLFMSLFDIWWPMKLKLKGKILKFSMNWTKIQTTYHSKLKDSAVQCSLMVLRVCF